MIGWLKAFFAPGVASIEPAQARDAPRLAHLHAAAFHRGWSESDFEQMLAERNTMIDRLRMKRSIIGFAASRLGGDEAELLTIAIDARCRGRGLSQRFLETHLGRLAGRGIRTVFLEVEEYNVPATRLYQRAGFAEVGRRERYYRDSAGAEANALVLRRHLF